MSQSRVKEVLAKESEAGVDTVPTTGSNGANTIVQAATRPPGGTFGAPVDLSNPGQSAYSPQTATAPDGTTTAVWSRRYDANSFIIQSASTAQPSPLLQITRTGTGSGKVNQRPKNR